MRHQLRGVFQALIGILRTLHLRERGNPVQEFQALIGILRTSYHHSILWCLIFVSSPYRYSTNTAKLKTGMVDCGQFQALIGILRTLFDQIVVLNRDVVSSPYRYSTNPYVMLGWYGVM